jgi:hypothetical protein
MEVSALADVARSPECVIEHGLECLSREERGEVEESSLDARHRDAVDSASIARAGVAGAMHDHVVQLDPAMLWDGDLDNVGPKRQAPQDRRRPM